MNKKRIINLILTILLAVIVIITALFILWWNGLFLPDWIVWKENDIYYEGAKASLKDKKLTVVKDNEVLWSTEKNWYVQDVMVEDINFDGREELVVLLWKHGSFGKHMPMWQSRNDINLKQHIFIYQWDDNRENKLRAVWMSSEIDYQIESIARGGDRRLITNLKNGEHRLWQWQDFGLKLLGPALEHKLDYAAVGDNLLHLNLLNYADGDYDIFYKEITNEIESYDIASVNQETVFVDDFSQISDFPRFGTPVKVADSLKKAGFDIVTLANNHIYDKRDYGLKVTTEKLDELGIIYTGISRNGEISNEYNAVKFIEKNGIRIALLNYTYGTNGMGDSSERFIIETLNREDRMINQIDYAKDRADIVIVYPHWGEEYNTEITDEQKRLCDIFMDHKVDVVIGTHPHVVQENTLYEKEGHKMYVYYSLGNFVSGQNKPGTTEGAIALLTFSKDIDGSCYVSSFDMKTQAFFVVNKE